MHARSFSTTAPDKPPLPARQPTPMPRQELQAEGTQKESHVARSTYPQIEKDRSTEGASATLCLTTRSDTEPRKRWNLHVRGMRSQHSSNDTSFTSSLTEDCTVWTSRKLPSKAAANHGRMLKLQSLGCLIPLPGFLPCVFGAQADCSPNRAHKVQLGDKRGLEMRPRLPFTPFMISIG